MSCVRAHLVDTRMKIEVREPCLTLLPLDTPVHIGLPSSCVKYQEVGPGGTSQEKRERGCTSKRRSGHRRLLHFPRYLRLLGQCPGFPALPGFPAYRVRSDHQLQ